MTNKVACRFLVFSVKLKQVVIPTKEESEEALLPVLLRFLLRRNDNLPLGPDARPLY